MTNIHSNEVLESTFISVGMGYNRPVPSDSAMEEG